MGRRHGMSKRTAAEGKTREIGERIVQARREAGGMRQEELADLIGVSVRSMQAYESGEVVPYRYLKELERVLGRPMAWILHGDQAIEGSDRTLARIEQKLDRLLELLSEKPSRVTKTSG